MKGVISGVVIGVLVTILSTWTLNVLGVIWTPLVAKGSLVVAAFLSNGTVSIETGQSPKTTDGTLPISFKAPFCEIPTVTVSSVYEVPEGSSLSVQHVEFITKVDKDHFTVESSNGSSSGYYVNWIAVGKEHGCS